MPNAHKALSSQRELKGSCSYYPVSKPNITKAKSSNTVTSKDHFIICIVSKNNNSNKNP